MDVHSQQRYVVAVALLATLGSCATSDPAADPSRPERGVDDAPSKAEDAAVAARDGGKQGTARDAGTSAPSDAAIERDGGGSVPDAATRGDSTLTDSAVDDAAVGPSGHPTDAGGDSVDAGGPPEAVQKPVFQKTRCIDPSKVQADKELNFPCDGIDVWVVVPSACFDRACGVVFNIHGGGMSDHATMDQATHMIAIGSAAGYIVVHPHKGTWNVATDKTSVFDFLQQVVQAFDADKKRVHSTGYSQGGQISWALGCEHADVVASIAPAEEVNRVSDCWKTSKKPARELPILFAYGKKDSIGGGYDAAQTLAKQVATTSALTGPETVAGKDGSNYLRQRWTSASGNVLEFVSHNYTSTGVGGVLAGHCLPMADGTTFVSCSRPVDYDWGQEVISFFKAHPQP
jgi:poly(3-hydroxybutyrate) depolymerase